MNAPPCVSCKMFTAMRKKSCKEKDKKGSGNCDVSQCALKTAPIKYKLNEKNYYSEMHVAWRYHCHNRKFIRKYPFCKTNYLRVGPGGELIWGRNIWDKIFYYKRCPGNRQCCPWQFRGYTAWLKPENPHEDPVFTGGPKGGNIVASIESKDLACCSCLGSGLSGNFGDVIVDKRKKRFRFLGCGPLKPGWGCSGHLGSHIGDGFCPQKGDCECRGVWKAPRGCGECCQEKFGKPGRCRQCCPSDKLTIMLGKAWAPQSETCCVCEEEKKERTYFGRKSLFKPLEKVPPMDLNVPFLDKYREKKEAEQRQRLEGYNDYMMEMEEEEQRDDDSETVE